MKSSVHAFGNGSGLEGPDHGTRSFGVGRGIKSVWKVACVGGASGTKAAGQAGVRLVAATDSGAPPIPAKPSVCVSLVT
jgi:hypothetical protein